MAKSVEITVDELIATLRRTRLPTAVIEGKDDVIVLRRIEDIYRDAFVSIIVAGGRQKVLEAFRRRSEIHGDAPLVFVVDRDSWVVCGIPVEFISEQIVCSDGYSIENDIIRDGNFENMMNEMERNTWRRERAAFIEWFAVEFSDFIQGKDGKLKTYAGVIVDDPDVLAAAKARLQIDDAAARIFDTLSADPERLVRGKSLMDILMRQLSYTGRSVRHRREALLQFVAANPGPLVGRIYGEVGSLLTR